MHLWFDISLRDLNNQKLNNSPTSWLTTMQLDTDTQVETQTCKRHILPSTYNWGSMFYCTFKFVGGWVQTHKSNYNSYWLILYLTQY